MSNFNLYGRHLRPYWEFESPITRLPNTSYNNYRHRNINYAEIIGKKAKPTKPLTNQQYRRALEIYKKQRNEHIKAMQLYGLQKQLSLRKSNGGVRSNGRKKSNKTSKSHQTGRTRGASEPSLVNTLKKGYKLYKKIKNKSNSAINRKSGIRNGNKKPKSKL